MIKFVCDNGSFEIQSSREARNYNNSKVIKSLEIMVSSQDITIDEIEKIITNPIISSFSIVNDNTGLILNTFEGYNLSNISRMTQGSDIMIMINFMKGDN